ncbi:MAG: Ig-like domain-containing protein, partial [Candidatus Symbiothrix sp.]|nr:Ig-like domain-containing protein [Candidatus Symbiothrix sp.]
MQKYNFLRNVVAIAICLAATMTFSGCDPEDVEVTGVSLNPTTLTLEIGKTAALTATITPSDATDKSLTWLSANSQVAVVDNKGTVAAIGEGTTNIIVETANGLTDTCTVTVIQPTGGGGGGGTDSVAVISVTVYPSAVTLKVGETAALTATVEPTNATNKSVTWNSGNPSVATVNASGVVTAVSEGTAIIACNTVSGAKSDTCVVTVTNQTTTKKYITYNKPVPEYYMEYKSTYPAYTYAEACENRKYATAYSGNGEFSIDLITGGQWLMYV